MMAHHNRDIIFCFDEDTKPQMQRTQKATQPAKLVKRTKQKKAVNKLWLSTNRQAPLVTKCGVLTNSDFTPMESSQTQQISIRPLEQPFQETPQIVKTHLLKRRSLLDHVEQLLVDYSIATPQLRAHLPSAGLPETPLRHRKALNTELTKTHRH